jgi:hypothetical protein
MPVWWDIFTASSSSSVTAASVTAASVTAASVTAASVTAASVSEAGSPASAGSMRYSAGRT